MLKEFKRRKEMRYYLVIANSHLVSKKGKKVELIFDIVCSLKGYSKLDEVKKALEKFEHPESYEVIQVMEIEVERDITFLSEEVLMAEKSNEDEKEYGENRVNCRSEEKQGGG